MQLGNYRLDQRLLGSIAGARELGLYSVAVAWAEALWFLPTALAQVQRPDLVRVRSHVEAARRAARAFRGRPWSRWSPARRWSCSRHSFARRSSEPSSRLGRRPPRARDGRLRHGGAQAVRERAGRAGHPGLQSVAIGSGFALTVLLDVILIPELGGLGAAPRRSVAYTAAGVVVIRCRYAKLGGRAADLVPRRSDIAWFTRSFARANRLRRSGGARVAT